MDAYAQAGDRRIAGGHAGDPSATSDAGKREGGRDVTDWKEKERAFALLTFFCKEWVCVRVYVC